ncbi:MAG: Uma2 family endonuclease [Alphaproteobacteria bacterium]|nr:Uma2 family endonuclease [Alphaproteobacteria bacterium]MCB9692701.1 Uma2 family endonuclease [Alphaproteobacteria bacterium]
MEALRAPASYAEYLEQQDLAKSIWVRGEVFAMSGASRRHNRLATRLLGELYGSLRDTPCRPVNSDQRVRVDEADASFYPDVTVVCGPDAVSPVDAEALTNPAIVFEVLSPSTEAYDRGGEFAALQRLPSLTHYVLLSQDRPRVEVFERQGPQSWTLTVVEDGAVRLPHGVVLDLPTLYADA